MYRNSEGYADPTAGAALSRMMKEFRQEQNRRYADKNRKKVYVASKYAGNVDANVTAAIGYCRKVIYDGYMPIASHLLYPQILNDNIPAERELGLLFGLALIRISDEVWVFGEITPGVTAEIEEAKKLKKQIRYLKGVDA